MRAKRALVATTLGVALFTSTAGAQGWPDVYDPLVLKNLHLELDPADWQTVQEDETLDIEVPAMFWADGEPEILISVRRKSADPLTENPLFAKVSLKLDINEYVPGQDWHDLKKLSLENGDDQDVVSEGLAWQIERLASGTQGYGYQVGHFAWVRLYINDIDTGVYVNVEQPDKRFLENRGLYIEGAAWLYKVSDVGGLTMEEGGPDDSPTVEALCYDPFDADSSCPQPDLATDVPLWVDMHGILTLMASDAFQANSDAMLSHGKNFYFADFLGGTKRLYFPWDRDSSISGGGVSSGIYGGGSDYASLLDVPAFRTQYSEIFNDLICGPWSAESLVAFLNAAEPVISDAVSADLNNQLGGSVAEHFDGLRDWVTQRVDNVSSLIEGFQPCPSIYVIINEFMADNFSVLEDPDEPGEYPDWIELYNPGPDAVSLGGAYLTDDVADPMKYQIPVGVSIPAGGYLVFWADDDGTQGPLHTNFKLSAGGEAVGLFDPDGVTEIDSIVFGAQMTNVSYGRYPNGFGPWGFMSAPTPGAANGPHNAPPVITGTVHTPAAPSSADTVWITAAITDADGAVAGAVLTYDAGAGPVDVTMYDDGAHSDGAAGDEVYGGQIPASASGSVVHYYVFATDNLGASSTDPSGAPLATYAYAVDYVAPPLYINEFMAANATAYEDPGSPGDFDDWVEIYNAGPSTIDMGGMFLTDDLTDPTKWQVPAGVSVPSGGYLILWADEDGSQGVTHMNFKLSAGGEQIGLFDRGTAGTMPIDTLSFGAQATDVSMGRLPDGASAWEFFARCTPGGSNGGWYDCEPDGDVDLADVQQFSDCMGGPDTGAAGCGVFDPDQDEDVDLSDFVSFQRAFTG